MAIPSRKMHNRFAAAFGIDPKLANKVNADIDKPAKRLGPSHRKERHDDTYALFLGIKYNNWDAAIAALLHHRLDEVANNPEIRRMLKIIEAIS